MPIYTIITSSLLYYGYNKKYNETLDSEDSHIFIEDNSIKQKVYLFDENQIMHIKNTYANELTSKVFKENLFKF